MIEYKPPPVTKKFINSEAFVSAILGPFGSGKSVGCVMNLLKRAIEQEPDARGVRPTRFAIIRNTSKMLIDTTQKTVFEWVPPGKAGQFKITRQTYDLDFLLEDGTRVKSEWLFRALDGPEDARNLLSLELTGAWINEYREMNPDIFVSLIGRVGRYPSKKTVPPTWSGVIMDSNPPPTSSYWYSFFEEGVSDEVQSVMDKITKKEGSKLAELFKQPSGLSPDAENIENLPDNYYETLLALNQDKSEEWVKVHVHGQYGHVQDGLPIYPKFDPAIHLAKEAIKPIKGKPISIGMDWGLDQSAVFVQQDAKGRWLILGELTTNNTGTERFMELLIPHLKQTFPDNKVYEVWGDPAGQQRAQTDERTCFQVVRSHGFTIRPGAQSLEIRLGSVRRVLSRVGGVLIDPSCKMLIRGFHGEYKYRRIQGTEGRFDPKPEKNSVSHIHDALNHMMGIFEGPAMEGRTPRKWGTSRGNKPTKRRSFNVY